MDERSDSRVIGREPCPGCGSRDNLARYDDGHAYCFTPGCGHFEKGDGDGVHSNGRRGDGSGGTRRAFRAVNAEFLEGTVMALTPRGISQETAAKFGVSVGRSAQGKPCVILPYRDRETGLDVVAQKLRFKDKDAGMPCIGDIDAAGLFGQHLWRSGGKRVVVTEGEYDAMAVAQAFNLSWPAVSIKRGAASAKKDIQQSLEWLEGYDQVVLWMDNDEAGKRAVAECVPLFSPGKVRIVETPQ